MSAPAVRPIAADELHRFLEVKATAFLSPPPTAAGVEARRRDVDIERCLAAVDARGRMCGVARSFATPLTVPGGVITASAVSSVGVLPTHRRQGHLTRLMRHHLDDAVERGEPVAVLIAAEYPIYGRYGYGPATEATTLRVDAHAAAWLDAPRGEVELVDGETFAKVVEELYDRIRPARPGHIGASTQRWQVLAALLDVDDGDHERRRNALKALWRDGGGEVQGAVTYTVDETWKANRPAGKAHAELLVAATPRAEIELLRYLASVDWIATATVALRTLDDPAPLALVDGRAAQLVDRSDHVWLRVLDLPAAVAARRYAAPASLVLEVRDPMGYADGRYRLDVGPDGGDCAPTTDQPDLTVGVGALGAAYLGGHSWQRLAAAGWVDEHRPGAVAAATAAFVTARAPWCAFIF